MVGFLLFTLMHDAQYIVKFANKTIKNDVTVYK